MKGLCAISAEDVSSSSIELTEAEIRANALRRHRGSVPAISISSFNRLALIAEKSGQSSPKKSAPVEVTSKYLVLLLGAPKVGKTSIIHKFLFNKFLEKYKRTVEDFYTESFIVAGRRLELCLLDTEGSKQFPAMRSLNIMNADGFVLVFDITNGESWDEIKNIYEEIQEKRREHNSSNAPMVVVGNKSDLYRSSDIDFAEVVNLVELTWGKDYSEISVKNDNDVVGIFKKLFLQANVTYPLFDDIRRRKSHSDTDCTRRRSSFTGMFTFPKVRLSGRRKSEEQEKDISRRVSCKIS